MKTAVLGALIALNVLLLASFLSRFAAPDAPRNAAIAQVTRRPGEYAMIPGLVTGGSSGVVYVIDTTNGLLTAVTYDQSSGVQGRLASLPQINLTDIFARGAGAVPVNPPGKGPGKGR